MKRTKISRLVALALLPAGVALAAGPSFGAATKSDAAAPHSGSSAAPAASPDKGASAAQGDGGAGMKADRGARGDKSAGADVAQKGDSYWGSDLVGMNVAMAGDREGEIKDLAIDTQSGEVLHAITEIEGKDGKEQLYAVPLDKFQPGEKGKLALNVDENWLAQQTPLPDEKRTTTASRKRPSSGDGGAATGPMGGTPGADQAAGAREPGAGGPGSDKSAGASGASGGSASIAGDKSARAPGSASAGTRRLSNLIGRDVENAQGKEVGEIGDAVVNLKSRKVEFVALEYDPGVTSMEKTYAFPLTAFKFPAAAADGSEGSKRVVLNVSEEKLKDMKPLTKDDRKRINDPGWMSQIKSAF
jgi:sporulation protein YlmC with PRC-barrel domain